MLQRLQKQKGGQQKRHGLRGIQKRVQDCIQYHFYTSFYRNVLSKPSLYDKKFLSQEWFAICQNRHWFLGYHVLKDYARRLFQSFVKFLIIFLAFWKIYVIMYLFGYNLNEK